MERENKYKEIQDMLNSDIPLNDIMVKQQDPIIEDPAEENICLSCE